MFAGPRWDPFIMDAPAALKTIATGELAFTDPGAIYMDGNTIDRDLGGSLIRGNRARAGGGAIFFVSNDLSGHLRIRHSTLERNPSESFETPGMKGVFYRGQDPTISDSILR